MNKAVFAIRVAAIIICALILTLGSVVMEPATHTTREGTEQC